jgi:hypothetical protein
VSVKNYLSILLAATIHDQSLDRDLEDSLESEAKPPEPQQETPHHHRVEDAVHFDRSS